MAYKARTLLGKPNEPNAYAGWAPPRVVAGVEVPSRLKAFPGKPPKELLEDDQIDVQTCTGDPWPRSSCDRNSKKPNHMRIREDEGQWPSERDKAIEAFAEKQLANPEHVARHLLKLQGMPKDRIEERIGRMRSSTKNIPDVPDPEPPKRGPGRPRKSAEE